MKASELRNKSIIELQDELQVLLRERFNLNMQRGVEQTVRSHVARNVRRNIARVKTIIQEKQSNKQ